MSKLLIEIVQDDSQITNPVLRKIFALEKDLLSKEGGDCESQFEHHGNSHHGNSHHGNSHHGNSHHGNSWFYPGNRARTIKLE